MLLNLFNCVKQEKLFGEICGKNNSYFCKDGISIGLLNKEVYFLVGQMNVINMIVQNKIVKEEYICLKKEEKV